MKHHVVGAVAAATLALLGATARASTAVATLSDFRIQLIDLNKTDGIAPWITFENLQGGTFVAAEGGKTNPFGNQTFNSTINFGGSMFGNASAAGSLGSANGTASLTGDPLGRGAKASVTAAATGHDTFGAGSVGLGDGGTYVSFTLSPGTRLVITGEADTSATSTIVDPNAETSAAVWLKLTDFTGIGSQSYASAFAQQGSMPGAAPFATTDHEFLSVSFENDSVSSAGGIFFGSLDASASDVAPPAVPEPAGLTLMLVGLGLVGFMKRRHRRID